MRHTAFAIVVSTLLFSACAERSTLAPENVLNRSSVANSGLVSARISIDATLATTNAQQEALNGSLNVQGTMQQGGRQLDVVFNSQGQGSSTLQQMTWDVGGRLIVLSENEVFLRTDTLSATPPLPISLGETGVWYRLPSTGTTTADITPDPRLLRLQSEAVRVIKDHGIVTVDGKRMHHYEVTIDPQRLAAYLSSLPESEQVDRESLQQLLAPYDATGKIWIEEDTYLLTKAVWDISKKGDASFALTLSMNISDAGLPVTITAPDDAQSFPQFPFLPATDALILQEF